MKLDIIPVPGAQNSFIIDVDGFAWRDKITLDMKLEQEARLDKAIDKFVEDAMVLFRVKLRLKLKGEN